MRVQAHAEGDDLKVVFTPADTVANPGIVSLNCYMIYGRDGKIAYDENWITADLPRKILGISTPPRPLIIRTNPSYFSHGSSHCLFHRIGKTFRCRSPHEEC